MKIKSNFRLPFMNLFVTLMALSSVALLGSCDDDDEPVKEDTPELITKATLTFTPTNGGTPITATATDPDGVGVQNITTDNEINLAASTSYTLTIQLINELADPNDAEYNITEEVEEEGDEHMLFFSWTNNVFSDPAGDGNIDNRADDVNYNDEDESGLPIGINTSWTAGTASSGKFRIVLKHQPGLKTTASSASTGETDLDLEFDITID